MVELKRAWTWADYVPDIGENRSLPEPFKLRVRSGVPRLELQTFEEEYQRLDFDQPDAVADQLSKMIEFGPSGLVVDGRRIEDMRAYVRFLYELSGVKLVREMATAVGHFNSVRGTVELFYAAVRGGTAFTTGPRAGRADVAPEGP